MPLALSASGWSTANMDTRVLTTLWHAGERYIRIGFGLLDPDPEEHHRRQHAHKNLIDVYRRRDPDAAALAVDEHLHRNEKLAASALGPDTSLKVEIAE